MNLLRRISSRYRRTVSESWGRRVCAMRNAQSIISFSFDDFPLSALTNAAPLFREYGISATYYVSMGLLGTHTPTGHIVTKELLPDIMALGHELGCHTFDHCHAFDTPTAAFEASVRQNRETLSALVPGARFVSLSYPIASPRPSTKRQMARHFVACRAGGQVFNTERADLNALKAFFLEQSRDDFSAIRAIIEANHQAKGWLIFATHDVQEKPTRYGVTPSFFADVVACAARSGSRIVPVSQALEMIGASTPSSTHRFLSSE